MERRHQVFISSTFIDLIDERREVIEALLEMDAIPAGMELFAAGDTDQWTLIKQVIDQSDYYLVIVGGRYGSMTTEGLSYTEMEYDYAVAQGVPVMGFVHADPNAIPRGKSEMDPETSAKLEAFRQKVMQKIVKTYSTPAELGGVVSRGLIKLQRDAPRPGWVRGDHAMTPETESRMAEMRAEIAELHQAASERKASAGLPKIEGLASGDEPYDLEMRITGTSTLDKDKAYGRKSYYWNVGYSTNWNEILQVVGPSLMEEATEVEITDALESFGQTLIQSQPKKWPDNIDTAARREIESSAVEDVIVQLFALDLIEHGLKKRTTSDRNKYWRLTATGQDQVMRLRAIRGRTPEEITEAFREQLAEQTVPQLRELARDLGLPSKGVKLDLINAIAAARTANME